MKRLSFFVVLLIIVAVAVFVAVAVDGNEAGAFPTGWDGGCGTCHNGTSGGTAPPAHGVASHASVYPSDCAACHTTAPAIDAANCVACHTSIANIAAQHPASAGCAGANCHPAATTTTTAATTTTTAATTTTTAGSTTSTTGATTSTTAPTTTSTTLPTGVISVTG